MGLLNVLAEEEANTNSHSDSVRTQSVQIHSTIGVNKHELTVGHPNNNILPLGDSEGKSR